MSLYKRPLGAGTMVALAAVTIALLVFGVSFLRADANAVLSEPAPLPVRVVQARYDSQARIDEFYPGWFRPGARARWVSSTVVGLRRLRSMSATG